MGNFFEDVEGFVKNVGDRVEGFLKGFSGESQADSALKGAELSSEGQREQLEYLKEINKLPQQYKEQALTELAGLYLSNDPTQQQAMIDKAKNSPIYKEIMSGQKAGEEAVARNAAATGGLRSGNTNAAFMDYNTQLRNKALTSHMSGLEGLAGIRTNENQIGNVMGGIGDVLSMGQIAAGNAMAQGQQNTMNTGLAIASLYI